MARKLQIPLDKNPEFAAALGRLLGHWAIVESELISILQVLLGTNQPRAQIVFMTFIALRGKINLMQRMTHNFVDKSPEKDRLLSLLKEAGKLNGMRNDFIHATWAAGSKADSLTRFSNMLDGDLEKAFTPTADLTALDVQKVVDRIAALSLALQDFQFHDVAKLVIHQVPPSWMPSP